MKINPNQIRKILAHPEKRENGVLPSSRDNYITREGNNYRKAYIEIFLNENIMSRQEQYKYFNSEEEMENWLEKYVPNFIDL